MTLTILLILISGLANGLMDLISYKWDVVPDWMRKRASYWNPEYSWRNKWEFNYMDEIIGERFWLSSTALVWLTDGWHLMKEIMLSSLSVAIALQGEWWWYLVARGVFAIGFKITYR